MAVASLPENAGSTFPCGKVETHSIAPDREYVLYRPTRACSAEAAASEDILPLVFALHCLGCSSRTLLFWTELADAYNFVLVIPEGKYNSFNAKACCGTALKKGVDDVGFLRKIIEDVVDEQKSQPMQVSPDLVYAVGWSNGAYLATYAAHLFRAIAPISGFQVDPILAPLSKPVALFQHHAVDDSFVRIGGCCSNNASMPRCCCQLSELSEQCTSVQHHVASWAKTVNHCALMGGRDAASAFPASVAFASYHSASITCWSAPGCQANTTFCQHSSGGHFNRPSFQSAFPMAHQVADFFARDACMLHRGKWSTSQQECVCDAADDPDSAYCVSHGLPKQENKLSAPRQSGSTRGTLFLLVSAAVAVVICVFRARRRRPNEKPRQQDGFQPIPTIEMLSTTSLQSRRAATTSLR